MFKFKIFDIEENKAHYTITFLGIKIKLKSLKIVNKRLNKLEDATRGDILPFRQFINWRFNNEMSYKEKRWFLETMFYESSGYFPDLDNPKSFNEKINWMKLHYYNPVTKRCVDKYEFKNYIKEQIGDGYTIPLIGVYDNVNDIDFNSLPESFVIKSNNSWGGKGVKVVKNKSKLNIDRLKYEMNNLLQPWQSYYYRSLPGTYKEVQPKIIIEEYIEQLDGQLFDYKFYCFHGEPKLVLAIQDRKIGKNFKFEFVDMNWNRIFLHRGNKKRLIKTKKPKCFDEMTELARKLSKDFPFVRMDFYEVDGKIYVGEFTFEPAGGFDKYEPREWDYKLGEWIDLNKLEDEYIIPLVQ